MKKLMFIALAAMFASCCNTTCNNVCVDKLIANPAEFANKEVTFVGKAVVTNAEAKQLSVYGSDTTKFIAVQGVDSAKVCVSLCGQMVKVCGTVAENAGVYSVAAKCISKAECCKKDCKKACCKADGEKKCCKKDGEKACCKAAGGEKKCCKKETTSCPKAAEKK